MGFVHFSRATEQNGKFSLANCVEEAGESCILTEIHQVCEHRVILFFAKQIASHCLYSRRLCAFLFYPLSIYFSRAEIGENKGKAIAKLVGVWYNILVILFYRIRGGVKG